MRQSGGNFSKEVPWKLVYDRKEKQIRRIWFSVAVWRTNSRKWRSHLKLAIPLLLRDSETGKQGLDRPFSIYTRGVWPPATS